MPAEEVPLWDGDPSSFEAFATSCKWFECALKDSEKKLAAPKIWQRLSGAAKSVVRHLDPKDFSSDTGLEKLLRVLRESPLQKLPIPDSFSRLEKWSGLRRGPNESIPQLLVREEELFVELQQALQRARHERARHEVRSMAVGASEHDPPTSPTRSPNVTRAGLSSGRDEASFMAEEDEPPPPPMVTPSGGVGFFENELRGYRLLKASKLSQAERQHVLTLTKNSTHFAQIRQALRSLFSDGADQADDHHGRFPRKTVWFNEENNDWDYEEEWWPDDDSWWSEADAYWADWSPSSWDDGYEAEEPYAGLHDDGAGGQDRSTEEIEGEQRLEEAYALATEANKTLAEARQAVARVRAARGYFDPTGTKGHPGHLGGGKGKRKGSPPGKGKGSGGFGPCFICGQPGHGYAKCPDRWSGKGGKKAASSSPSSRSSFIGKGKGKNASKGKKGKVFFTDYEAEWVPDIYVLSLTDRDDFDNMSCSRVIIDTGATESVAGIRAMARLLDTCNFLYNVELGDRPRFRFGNGESLRAVSKVVLYTPALGELGFYLLDGGAEMTPPLLGARELKARRSVISYHGDYMAHRSERGNWYCSELSPLPSGHLTLYLQTPKTPIRFLIARFNTNPGTEWPPGGPSYGDEDDEDPDGDDPGARRPKRRREDPTAALIRGHATGTTRPPAPTTSGMGRAAERGAHIESDESPNLSPSVVVEPEEPPPTTAETAARPAPKTPSEHRETYAADTVIVRHPSIDLEDSESHVHEDVPESNRGCEGQDSVMESSAVTSASCHGEHAPAHEPVDHAHGEHAPVHEPVGHAHEDHHSIHSHDECQSAVVNGTIFMVQEDGTDDLSSRLSILAQRLREHQAIYISSPEDEVTPTVIGSRSPTSGMAMPWRTSSGTRALQWLSDVAGMQPMRPSTSLRDQREGNRSDTGSGTASRSGRAGPGGAEVAVCGPGDDGEDLQREVDGDQRPDAGAERRTQPDDSASPSGREVGRGDDGQCLVLGELPNSEPNEAIQGDQGTLVVADTKDSCKEAHDPGGGDHCSREDEEHPGTCEDGEDREGQEGNFIGSCDPSGHERQLRGDGAGDLGQRSGEDGGGEGRLAALWSKLRGIKSRMQRNVPDGTPCQDRLEADDGINTLTTSLSPTRQSSPWDGRNSTTRTTSTTKSSCPMCPTSTTASNSSKSTVAEELSQVVNMTEKQVRPSLARRLATAAALTCTLMAPLRELVGAVTPQVDVMEIACSPNSTLTATFEEHGFCGQRINYVTGYDLSSRKGTAKLANAVVESKPKLAWVSMSCTRLSALQNLTPRTPEELDRFLQRRGQDLRRCEEVALSLEPILENGDDVAWEWPTTAVAGWRSRAIERLKRLLTKHHRQIYWVRIDGCAYGLEWQGVALKKSWTILTTSRELWLTLNKRCDRSHEHAQCRGNAAQSSAYYPPKMCQAICKAMMHLWQGQDSSLERAAELYLLDTVTEKDVVSSCDLPRRAPQSDLPGGEEQVLALSRRRLDLDTAPTGKKLEAVKQLMLRVHRASGHAGMSNLVQLLKDRGSPGWAIEVASKLECPECIEAAKVRPRPPASTSETPAVFAHLGSDVFEHEEP